MSEDKKGTIIFYENQYSLCDYYDNGIKLQYRIKIAQK